MHDEVAVYDAFPGTIQKLDEDENLTENTTAQDDQEDETEQSLSESLQTRRQISKIHENIGQPSNRTLVRVLRLGGDSSWQPPGTNVVLVRHRNVQPVQA